MRNFPELCTSCSSICAQDSNTSQEGRHSNGHRQSHQQPCGTLNCCVAGSRGYSTRYGWLQHLFSSMRMFCSFRLTSASSGLWTSSTGEELQEIKKQIGVKAGSHTVREGVCVCVCGEEVASQQINKQPLLLLLAHRFQIFLQVVRCVFLRFRVVNWFSSAALGSAGRGQHYRILRLKRKDTSWSGYFHFRF